MNVVKFLILAFCSASIVSCVTTTREYLVKSGYLQREFTVGREYKELYNDLGKKISVCASKGFIHKPSVELALNEERKIATIDMFMENFDKKGYLVAIEIENKDQKNSTVRIHADGSGWNRYADQVTAWANGDKTECK